MVEQETQAQEQEQYRNFSIFNIFSWIIHQIMLMCQGVIGRAQRLFKDLHVNEIMDEAAVYLAQHPIMALILIAMAISCGIPVLMFLVFALLTVVLTFAGFIVIEGTLLTVGSILLCGFVLAMLIVMVTIAATVGVAYLGFIEIYGLLQNSPDDSPVARFLPSKLSPVVNTQGSQHSMVSTTVQDNHED